MRDRCRQFSGRCLAAHMSELRCPVPGFDLSNLALSSLVQQQANKDALDQDYTANRDALPAISLPECELAKPDLAARRWVRLTDLPSLHLRPIENRLYSACRRSRSARRLLTVEYPQRLPCRIS